MELSASQSRSHTPRSHSLGDFLAQPEDTEVVAPWVTVCSVPAQSQPRVAIYKPGPVDPKILGFLTNAEITV